MPTSPCERELSTAPSPLARRFQRQALRARRRGTEWHFDAEPEAASLPAP